VRPEGRRDAPVPHHLRLDDRLDLSFRLSAISLRSFDFFPVNCLSIKSADGLFNCLGLSAAARNAAAAAGVGLQREAFMVGFKTPWGWGTQRLVSPCPSSPRARPARSRRHHRSMSGWGGSASGGLDRSMMREWAAVPQGKGGAGWLASQGAERPGHPVPQLR